MLELCLLIISLNGKIKTKYKSLIKREKEILQIHHISEKNHIKQTIIPPIIT
jgi:hypothetical protein